MEPGAVTPQARRLREALRRQGVTEPDNAALEEVARRWAWSGQISNENRDPLARLDTALRVDGITLEAEALAAVAWAMLGVPVPRSARLGNAVSARLTHLAELHDLTFPSAARTLARQLAGEGNLAPDLLRARPWLSGPERLEEVLTAVFQTEWSGFLALLGEFGPWVYVPSVADLQALSHHYAALVQAASVSRDVDVLAAAWQLQRPGAAPSLLARLEVSDYRRGAGQGGGTAPELIRLERAFWEAAERQARGRRDERAARRR